MHLEAHVAYYNIYKMIKVRVMVNPWSCCAAISQDAGKKVCFVSSVTSFITFSHSLCGALYVNTFFFFFFF